MLHRLRRRATLAGTAAALGLVLAACGGGDDTDDAADTTSESAVDDPTSEEEMSEEETSDGEMSEEEMSESEVEDAESASEDGTASGELALEPVGDACDQIPADGDGSSEGMADDTVGVAASSNPLLTTLTTAVEAAGLGGTLESLDDATVFAPIDAAFEDLPTGALDSLMSGDSDQLTTVLQTHVVTQSVQVEDFEDGVPITTASGTELMVEVGEDGELPTLSTSTSSATVVCGDIQTANATVHLIDGVLMPDEG